MWTTSQHWRRTEGRRGLFLRPARALLFFRQEQLVTDRVVQVIPVRPVGFDAGKIRGVGLAKQRQGYATGHRRDVADDPADIHQVEAEARRTRDRRSHWSSLARRVGAREGDRTPRRATGLAGSGSWGAVALGGCGRAGPCPTNALEYAVWTPARTTATPAVAAASTRGTRCERHARRGGMTHPRNPRLLRRGRRARLAVSGTRPARTDPLGRAIHGGIVRRRRPHHPPCWTRFAVRSTTCRRSRPASRRSPGKPPRRGSSPPPCAGIDAGPAAVIAEESLLALSAFRHHPPMITYASGGDYRVAIAGEPGARRTETMDDKTAMTAGVVTRDRADGGRCHEGQR